MLCQPLQDIASQDPQCLNHDDDDDSYEEEDNDDDYKDDNVHDNENDYVNLCGTFPAKILNVPTTTTLLPTTGKLLHAIKDRPGKEKFLLKPCKNF